MDLRDRLRVHLDAETTAIRAGDIGEVMERGDSIRRRRKVLMTATPVVAMAAVVVAFVLVQDDERPGREIERLADGNAVLSVQPVSFDWEAQPSPLGWDQKRVEGEDMLYVLSTAPGARWEDFPNGVLPKAVYASSDGIEWSAHPLGGSWAADLTTSQGVLYAVGTAPAAQGQEPTLLVGRSDDSGSNFELTEFPLGLDPRAFVTTKAAGTESGVVMLASGRISTDPWSLLPPGAIGPGEEPVMTPDGIAVVPTGEVEQAYSACLGRDPEACNEFIESEASLFTRWEELGLDSEDVHLGDIVRNVAYWSADGIDFERIEYPLPDGFIDGVFQVDGEAVISVDGNPFASADAREWRPIGDGVLRGPFLALGKMGDQVVGVSQPNGTDILVMSAPDLDGPWQELELGEALGFDPGSFHWITAAVVDDRGVALNVTSQRMDGDPRAKGEANPLTDLARRVFRPDEGGANDIPQVMGTLLYSTDLANWSAVDTSGMSTSLDQLYLTPEGNLVAQGMSHLDGGAQRLQFTTQPGS